MTLTSSDEYSVISNQVSVNSNNINNLLELFSTLQEQVKVLNALSPIGVTYITNPLSNDIEGNGKNINNINNLNITGTATIGDTLQVTDIATFNNNISIAGDNLTNGNLIVGGYSTIGSYLTVSGITTISDLTDSSSSSTGALKVSGGVGIAKNLFVGQNLNVSGSTTIGSLITGNITGTSLNISGNAIVTGSLNVSSSGTFNSLLVTNNGTIGGTLSVTGLTTLGELHSGVTTVDSLSVTNNQTIGGTLTVTNATTLSNTLSISGSTIILDSTDVVTTPSLSGALVVSGGVGIAKGLNVAGIVNITNTTNAISRTTGALVVTGGVGISGHLHVLDLITHGGATIGGLLTASGSATINGVTTMVASATIGGSLTVSGFTIINDNTQSTDTSSGALIVAGGVGIAKNLNVGGTLNVTGATTLSDILNISGATTCGNTLTVNGISTFNTGVNLVETLTVGGIAQFNNDLQFSMSSLGNSYFGYIYEQSNGDSLFLDGPAPSDYNQFGEKIQIRSVSSSGTSMSLNCYDAGGSSNSARITFRRFAAETGTNGPVNNHAQIRANDVLGYIDWKANTSASTVNDTRLAWIKATAITGGGGGQISLSTQPTAGGNVKDALYVHEDSSVQIGISAEGNTGGWAKFYVYNDTNLDTVRIVDTSTGTLGCQLDLLHHSSTPNAADEITQINFGGLDSSLANTYYGRISCVADEITNTAEKGSISFFTLNGTLTQKMILKHDGKVGINVSDPKCALHIYNPLGGDATNAQEMETHGILRLQPHATNSTNMTFAQVNNGDAMGIQVSNSAQTAKWDLSLQPFQGRVGVATTDPSARFSVVEQEHPSNGVVTVNNATIATFAHFESGDNGNEAADIMLQLTRSYTSPVSLNDAAFIRAGKEKQWNISQNRDSYLAFGTRDSTNLPSEKMRISSSGYVGINETNPQRMFQITADDDITATTLFALRNNRPVSSAKKDIVISFRDTVYTDSSLTTIDDDFKEMSAIQHKTMINNVTEGLRSSILFYTRENNNHFAGFGVIGDKAVAGTYYGSNSFDSTNASLHPRSHLHIRDTHDSSDVSLTIQNNSTNNAHTGLHTAIYFQTTPADVSTFKSATIGSTRAGHFAGANALVMRSDSNNTGGIVCLKSNGRMTFGNIIKHDCGTIVPLSNERICIGSGVPGSGTFLDFNYGSNQINPSNGTTTTTGVLRLGNTNARFHSIFLASGSLNGSSDRKLKTDIEELSDKEKRVAIKAKTLLRKYKWKNEVEQDSENAKIHFGIIAQDLEQAFEEEGIDPIKYNIISKEPTEDGFSYGVYYIELIAFIIAAI